MLKQFINQHAAVLGKMYSTPMHGHHTGSGSNIRLYNWAPPPMDTANKVREYIAARNPGGKIHRRLGAAAADHWLQVHKGYRDRARRIEEELEAQNRRQRGW